MINHNHLEVGPKLTQMSNISSMEIAELRPFFTTAMKQLDNMHPPRAPEPQGGVTGSDSVDDTDLMVRNASIAPAAESSQ